MRTSHLHLSFMIALSACILCSLSIYSFAQEPIKSDATSPETTDSTAIQLKEQELKQTRLDYSIALKRPAPHWKMLKREEAKQLSGIAILGAIEPGRSFGLVLVEPSRGMTLDAYAQAILNHSPLQELLIEVAEAITYQGQESLKLIYSGDNDQGARVRYLSYVLIRDGYAFQISAGGRVGAIDPQELETFSKAVELLPQPVRGSDLPVEPLTDGQGLTWRSHQGHFESLLGSFKLSPPQDWSVQAGEAARSISPIATLVMSKRIAVAPQPELDLSLLISARACPDLPKLCTTWARAELIEAFELTPRQEGQIEWKVFDESVSFELFDRDGTPFSYALATLVREGEVFQLLAWTLKTQLPHAWMPLPEALRTLTPLSSARKSQLRSELSAIIQGDQGGAIRGDSLDSTSAWLGGQYVHEAYGVHWHLPSGLWTAQRHEQGSALSVLAFEAPLFALQGQLRLARRGGGLIEAHTEALSALKRELGGSLKSIEHGQSQLGGSLSHWTELEEQGERPLRYRLHTSLKDGIAAYMITWAPAPRFPRLAIEQAEAQLELGQYTPPFTMRTHCASEGACQTKISLKAMRFSLDGLPTGGDVTFYPNASVGERSISLTYQTNEALIGAVAVGHTRPDVLDPLAIAAAQRLIPKLEDASLTPQMVWIEGREARLLSWSSPVGDIKLYLIKRPPLIYGYFVIAPPGHKLLKSSEVRLTLHDQLSRD